MNFIKENIENIVIILKENDVNLLKYEKPKRDNTNLNIDYINLFSYHYMDLEIDFSIFSENIKSISIEINSKINFNTIDKINYKKFNFDNLHFPQLNNLRLIISNINEKNKTKSTILHFPDNFVGMIKSGNIKSLEINFDLDKEFFPYLKNLESLTILDHDFRLENLYPYRIFDFLNDIKFCMLKELNVNNFDFEGHNLKNFFGKINRIKTLKKFSITNFKPTNLIFFQNIFNFISDNKHIEAIKFDFNIKIDPYNIDKLSENLKRNKHSKIKEITLKNVLLDKDKIDFYFKDSFIKIIYE